MAFRHIEAIEVVLYGKAVGALTGTPGNSSVYAFEYYPAWIRDGFSINPLFLPLSAGVSSFGDLAKNTWYGLPPTIADSLPDHFGNSLINAKLAQLGVAVDEITPLDRLGYVADRAMGAMEYRPAHSLGREVGSIIDVSLLVDAARDAISGNLLNDNESKRALRRLLSVGTSAGGARAKAVVNIDFKDGRIVSGQRPKPGFASWILKLDGVGKDPGLGVSRHYGRIEYAYALMAKDAKIDMPEVRLLEENERAHFMVKRFDRTDPVDEQMPEKIHMQSLCALGHVDFNLIHTNDYASLISVIRRLGIGEDAVTEAFRRMAFNCMAMNCDDHTKNFSFLMDRNGAWSFAPAYDVTFAYNSQNIWLKEHLMGVNGKFSDITRKDLLEFADTHKIEYAKAALKDVAAAVGNWKDYAKQADLGDESTDAIAVLMSK